jgi:hypothetical protein
MGHRLGCLVIPRLRLIREELDGAAVEGTVLFVLFSASRERR